MYECMSLSRSVSLGYRLANPERPRMPSMGVEPDVMSYNAVIDACARSGDVGRAERWLEQMGAAGLPPNVVSYSSVLHACAKAIGRWEAYRRRRTMWFPWRNTSSTFPKPQITSYETTTMSATDPRSGTPTAVHLQAPNQNVGRNDTIEQGMEQGAHISQHAIRHPQCNFILPIINVVVLMCVIRRCILCIPDKYI